LDCRSLISDGERLQIMAESDKYRIRLDGSWSLKDFYELPHVFGQIYAFHCAFMLGDEARDPERLAEAFVLYPWRGGYSAVNFYNVISRQIPQGLRPKVTSIQYSSPGWFELSLWVAAARAVNKLLDTAAKANTLYSEIHKGLRDRRLLRIEEKQRSLQLAREEIDFVIYSSQRFAEALGFANLNELNNLTDNPIATLKILLSYYRRVRTLADYARRGKAEFPTEEPPDRLED
jgi:hypothetical protein